MGSRSDAPRLYDDAVEFEPTRRTRVKTLRTFALTSLLTLVLASCGNPYGPARKDAPPWHYWIATFIAASAVLLLLGLAVGYVVKVVLPKYRGR
jgi:hypothetical protein